MVLIYDHNTIQKFNDRTIQWNINNIEHVTPFSSKSPRNVPAEEQIRNVESTEVTEDLEAEYVNVEIQFSQLLNKYEHIFSSRPGKISNFTCQIKIPPGEPIYQRPYPIPVSRIDKVKAEINRMLALGIIEKSSSPWSSSIAGIEKKNGDIRVCIDARKINQRITLDREQPMNIEDILIKFKGSKYLSSSDLTAGYWQCPLVKECREVTAFLFQGRNYQFKVLPFGLIISVAEFQKNLRQSTWTGDITIRCDLCQ